MNVTELFTQRLNEKKSFFNSLGLDAADVRKISDAQPGFPMDLSSDEGKAAIKAWSEYYEQNRRAIDAASVLDVIERMERTLRYNNLFMVEGDFVGVIGNYDIVSPAGFHPSEGLFATNSPAVVQCNSVDHFPVGITRYWTAESLLGNGGQPVEAK